MGGLKKDLPIMLDVPDRGDCDRRRAGGWFFSKDEILAQTFFSGHTMLWVLAC